MSEWQRMRIKCLFASSLPGEWGRAGDAESGTPVLRSTNFRNDGSIDFSDIAYRTIQPSRLTKRRVVNGTLLIEKSGGSPTQPAGRVVFCDRDFNGTASNFIEVVNVKHDFISQYVAYLLFHLYESGLALKYQQQTTGIINFKLNQYVEEQVNLPSEKPEQAKIAEILSTVHRAIEHTEALIAKQQRIKTGLMQDLLTRGIDEHGNLRSESTHEFKDSRLGRIPIEWHVAPLDSQAVRGSGHTPSKRKDSYWNGGVKWVSLADSSKLDNIWIRETEKEISELGLKNSSAVLHPRGTVILSRDAGVGKSAILGDEMAVSQHFIAWRCTPCKLDNFYLYYWLQKDKPKFEGIASGSTIVTIGLQFFRDYEIAAPLDVREQEQIAKVLLNADLTTNSFLIVLDKLTRLKSSLMQDLLTGKKRVTSLLELEPTH